MELRLDPVDPVAQNGAGVARVDEVVDTKTLGARVRGALAGKLLFEFATPGLWIGRCLDLAAIGNGDTTLKRESAALGRGPSEDHTARPEVGGASHTVHLAHDHRHPGHGGLHDREERRDAVANRGRLLSL